VGPEYIAVIFSAVISSLTGGSWVAGKVLERHRERLKDAIQTVENQRLRINALEEHVNRMPLEYVLKVDFVRELQEMNDHFRAIHNKLDKLVEKLIDK
jgi:FtsZ-binding cell division protein ZapB